MLKLRQYFCKHDFRVTAEHRSSRQNLWKCKKCDVFCVQHYGLGISYKCKVPNLDCWIIKNQA